MSGASLIGFVGVLVASLLFITALVVWQEARRRPHYEPLEYVIEDAVKHVDAGLHSEGKSLAKADIRRILEYEVFYLQGLAQDDRRNPVETVAGGHDASVDYIVAQIEASHGDIYDPSDVIDVLRHEADYLMRIGAVGDPVANDGGEEE
jgi:hypothetical protein